LVGAMGLTCEAYVERLYRDARMWIVPDGTAQIQRLVIGRDLTGFSAVHSSGR
jgi:alkylation response protein AidB-like acyl-CoA dehydrogenase